MSRFGRSTWCSSMDCAFTVDHPEFVAIDRRGREVTFYADDNTQHFIDAGLIAELVLSTGEKPAGVPAPDGG